uniref:Uncharacterized protein n=1 Tax=Colobus angolensis palliatus TaxID=336983 RepID=A0A2K5I5A3_COLAP
MIAWDLLQPPQKVFLQGHLEKGWRSAKCQGGVAALDGEKVEKRKSVTLCQKKASAQQALPCCLIQEISPKHLH